MVYFTINPTNSGFSDQMMQFSAFYKLGRALGYKYIHTPFQTQRSVQIRREPSCDHEQDSMDIYEFLAFNRYMQAVSDLTLAEAENEIVAVPLGQQSFLQKHDVSFSQLSNYIAEIVLQHESASKNLLLQFSVNTSRQFFTLIHAHVPVFPDGLDLRLAFQQSAAGVPIFENPVPEKINVLVHIRQGDTAVIMTPWSTCIPVDRRRPGWMQEHDSLEDIGAAKNYAAKNVIGPILSVNDYYEFFSKLITKLDHYNFSTQLFSDGFERAFGVISSNSNLLEMDEDRMAMLKKSGHKYDEKQFQVFQSLKSCNQYIGETDYNLQSLIWAMLDCDIVILGYQQRMLPKLLANYRQSDMPAVIVLHKGTKPDYKDIACGWEDRFIFVDMRMPDFEMIANRLNQLVVAI